jgi:hypothetical protein
MILKNLADGSTLSLPDDLLWVDEHAWTPTVTSTSYLITGALLIQSATRQAGRPITLVAPSDMAWVTRAVVNQLYTWASSPGQTFELLLQDSRRFSVAFRHGDGALEAEAVMGFSTLKDSDFYRITVRLIEM